MNVLFLTLLDFTSIKEHGIYTDLLREFVKNNHHVYIVSPVERRKKEATRIIEEGKTQILKLRIGNTQKTNIIEKGISTLLLESQFKNGIKKFFGDIRFDLIIYSTPPITLLKAVTYVKKRDDAKTYLLLKDIFPQNAVDLGMLSTKGIKGLLYKYFRNKEKELYAVSDRIGCMSQANVNYVLKHNPEINPEKVEISPNSIEIQTISLSQEERLAMRMKYDLPVDRTIFVYGGNLGMPQGVSFIIECLQAESRNEDVFFFIVGDGTEFRKIESFVEIEKPQNVRLIKRLPRDDYDRMIAACDVGLIFLDHRFTIPNFPSRLLSYMQAEIPVLACTDKYTDVGKVIVEGGFGWWCESNDVEAFRAVLKHVSLNDFSQKREAGYTYLLNHYTTQKMFERMEMILT